MVNINPAYAGNRGVPSLSAIWREQWVGLPGAPTTKSFSYDFASNSKQVGIGIQLFEDKYVNYIKRTGAALNYNMKVRIAQQGVLSLGLKFGFYNDSKSLYNSTVPFCKFSAVFFISSGAANTKDDDIPTWFA
jgi:type IX secretion system PorP/SprF family membrane protein